MFPDQHHGHGLLTNTDSTEFHKFAYHYAKSLERNGLSSWKLNPVDNAHLQPATIASLFYYFSVSEPWVVLPMNAFLHALGGFILFYISFKITDKVWMGVLSSLPFVLFPSALTWYAQIHRDGFFIVGCYCMTLCVYWSSKSFKIKRLIQMLLGFFIGSLCIYVSREYALHYLLAASISCIIIMRCYIFIKNKNYFVPGVLCFLSLIASGIVFNHSIKEHGDWKATPETRWIYAKLIPNVIEHQLYDIVLRRDLFFQQYPEANTNLQHNRDLNSAIDVLAYLPKALFITYFYPNPVFGESFKSTIAMRVAKLEMTIIYLVYVLVLFVTICKKSIQVNWLLFVFSIISVMPFALAVSNLGTLYRIRYGSMMLIVCLLISAILQTVSGSPKEKEKL
jgi:hypothetical protein